MNDRDRLRASINADPSDMETRAVYADWLEEHGEDATGWRVLNELGKVPYKTCEGKTGWTFHCYTSGEDQFRYVDNIELWGKVRPDKAADWPQWDTAIETLEVFAEALCDLTPATPQT